MNLISEKQIFHGRDLKLRVLHSRHSSMSPHCHDFHELVVVRQSSGRHDMNGACIPLHTGDVFLIPCGRIHAYHTLPGETVDIFNIIFMPDLLRQAVQDLSRHSNWHLLFHLQPELSQDLRQRTGMLYLDHQSYPETAAMLERAVRLSNSSKTPGSATELFGLFFQLLAKIICEGKLTLENSGNHLSEISRLLTAFEHFPERHWNLQNMAEYIHLSEANLRLQFHNVTGDSPINYLLKLRLQKAADLLADKTLRIGEIAESTGFRDSNYFSRQFHRQFGISPRQFRERKQA